MKNILLLTLCLIALSVHGQNLLSYYEGSTKPALNYRSKVLNNIKSPNTSTTFNMSMYYGTSTKFGIDFTFGKKNIGGFGMSLNVGKRGVGKDYSETIGPNAFSDDIYDVFEADALAIYGIIGRRITNELTLAGKLGFSTRTKYYNGYDNYQILSPSGYWFTSTDAGTKLIIGAFTQYQIGNWSPYFGADTFSGITIGIGYGF